MDWMWATCPHNEGREQLASSLWSRRAAFYPRAALQDFLRFCRLTWNYTFGHKSPAGSDRGLLETWKREKKGGGVTVCWIVNAEIQDVAQMKQFGASSSRSVRPWMCLNGGLVLKSLRPSEWLLKCRTSVYYCRVVLLYNSITVRKYRDVETRHSHSPLVVHPLQQSSLLNIQGNKRFNLFFGAGKEG